MVEIAVGGGCVDLVQNCLLYTSYSENCVTVGATIRVIQKDGERVGKAVAILPDGNLLADFDGRPEALCAGAVSYTHLDVYKRQG